MIIVIVTIHPANTSKNR